MVWKLWTLVWQGEKRGTIKNEQVHNKNPVTRGRVQGKIKGWPSSCESDDVATSWLSVRVEESFLDVEVVEELGLRSWPAKDGHDIAGEEGDKKEASGCKGVIEHENEGCTLGCRCNSGLVAVKDARFQWSYKFLLDSKPYGDYTVSRPCHVVDGWVDTRQRGGVRECEAKAY
jgi:hypothetical protein